MAENWLLIAFIAPILWSIVNLIDVYFVGGVYSDEYDGAIIAGLFPLFSWLLVALGIVPFRFPETGTLMFLLSGVLFLLANFFYFKSLFCKNDTALTQIFFNLAVPGTLFLSWLLLGEKLTAVQYMGIAVVFVGASVLCFPGKEKVSRGGAVLLQMLPAVLCVSLSLVLSESAYRASNTSFFDGYLLFTIGMAFGACLIAFWDKQTLKKRMTHIGDLTSRYFLIFITAETLALLAVMGSQRAVDLSPSASFVVTIESLNPAFVMLFSVLLVLFLKLFPNQTHLSEQIYRNQVSGVGIKSIATVLVVYGIYLVS